MDRGLELVRWLGSGRRLNRWTSVARHTSCGLVAYQFDHSASVRLLSLSTTSAGRAGTESPARRRRPHPTSCRPAESRTAARPRRRRRWWYPKGPLCLPRRSPLTRAGHNGRAAGPPGRPLGSGPPGNLRSTRGGNPVPDLGRQLRRQPSGPPRRPPVPSTGCGSSVFPPAPANRRGPLSAAWVRSASRRRKRRPCRSTPRDQPSSPGVRSRSPMPPMGLTLPRGFVAGNSVYVAVRRSVRRRTGA
jgi:hypothetical protein